MKKKINNLEKRRELWAQFLDGMKNNEPAEIFDDRLLDAYNNKIINKKEFLELMKEIADIRAKEN